MSASASTTSSTQASSSPTHVVGIGASAGGLEALQALFAAMPADSGMAFVVVQHLSPSFKSLMPELLERQTAMPVVALTGDLDLQAGKVYVLTSGTGVTVDGNGLRVVPRDPGAVQHMPINRLFESLSSWRERAVGIVLSGTGSDGTDGARALQRAGALVMAQQPDTARFDAMPASAMAAGCVDIVCSPSEMPLALQAWVRDPSTARHWRPAEASDTAIRPAEPQDRILDLLRERFGLDFRLYKPGTLGRRIERFVQAGPMPRTLDGCLLRLQSDPTGLDSLFEELLIGVTRFFRDDEAYGALTREAIEPLVQALQDGDDLRIWVCGCSTGEEAYSMAMLALEAFARVDRQPRVRVIATDVHPQSLQRASSGVYDAEAIGLLPVALKERYFTALSNGRFRVNDQLRRAVIFTAHNVLQDPAFARIDLVSCRNLLIYLQPAAQARALAAFHAALRREGLLFLGESETPGELEHAFTPLALEWRLYRKRPGVLLPPELRQTGMTAPNRRPPAPRYDTRASQQLSELLLQRYIPSGLLVDSHQRIVHVYGDAGRYLHAGGGAFRGELSSLLQPPARAAVNLAMRKALLAQDSVACDIVGEPDAAGGLPVRVWVDPLRDERLAESMFMVRFVEREAPKLGRPTGEALHADTDWMLQVEALDAELLRTREALQHTVEELEAANEELQAGNEELMASNEELQSTNEELHAVNEELFSVNAEHEQKIRELHEARTDLENLIRATDLAIVFVDHEVRLRMFTPAATAVFPLRQGDIGRDLRDFMPRDQDERLLADIDAMLAGDEVSEREITRSDGRSLRRQLSRYVDSRAGRPGLVLTYVDVTALVQLREAALRHQAEARLQERQAFMQMLADHTPTLLAYWDSDRRLRFVNRAWRERWHDGREAAPVGLSIEEALDGRTLEALAPRFEEGMAGRPQRFDLVIDRPGTPPQHLSAALDPHVVGNQVCGLFSTFHDVSAIEQGREAMHGLFESAPMAMLLVSEQGQVLQWNRQACALLGRDPDRMTGLMIEDLVPPHLRERHRALRAGFSREGPDARRAMGERRSFPLLHSAGRVVQVDIHIGAIVWQGLPAVVATLAPVKSAVTAPQADGPELRSHRNFLANMSHEMRTPLNAIIGMTQLLALERPTQAQADRLRHVEEASKHLLGLVNDMLDLAKFEAGTIELEPHDFDLDEILQRSVALVAHRARAKQLPLGVEIDPDVPLRLHADGRRVEQVLVNLLGNAVKFTPAGRVDVRVSSQPASSERILLRIEVADTGIGIQPEQLGLLFQPFRQLGDAQGRKHGGTGLGLAICRELARAMGGECGVSSTPGHGSSFWFTLLCDQVQALPAAPGGAPSAERQAGAALRILVVEDDAVNRLVVSELIRSLTGQLPDTACDGEEALQMASEDHYHLILMDMQLPGIDGLETTRRLRAREGQLRPMIVALTANAFAEDAAKCLQAGMDGHLAKPVVTAELSALFRQVSRP